MPDKIAIVAALEREIRPLVRDWRISLRDHEGRRFKFFENDRAVAICGGIGAPAARRACEAVIALYQPALVISAGFAGALEPNMELGSAFTPRTVIDAQDGSRTHADSGTGTLITVAAVAGPAEKRKLASAYCAQAADMEAAAVARGAQARGIPFRALKAISDGPDSILPPIDRFIRHDGHLQTAKLAAYVAIRPWLWAPTWKLARNGLRASNTLCKMLHPYACAADEKLSLHPKVAKANH
jgi:adenosylhomocysteine nucleosidase